MTPQNPQRTKRFAIGLSFPEAYRKNVQAIADCLTKVFPKESILYDGYHEAELARPDKDIYLQDLYLNQTELVVVFLCHAYHEEVWCGLEWRAIRARMNAKDTSSIMLLQLDEGTPDGFFGNVDGYVDISRKSDSEVADLIVERLRLNKSEVNHITHIETDSYAELRKYLSQWLTDRRKEHPSFRLMEIDDELFPDCIPEYYNISATDDSGKTKSVAEIVSESWCKQKKNHLMIEGEGGIGKTVTLLSMPEKFVPHQVPAVYIQLHELRVVKEKETIEEYIERKMFPGKKTLFDQFIQLTGENWDNGPKLLLLLDGFNEIAQENRFIIGQDINDWADRPGIQIVTSSRYDIRTYVPLGGEYGRIHLQTLKEDTIKEYLHRLSIPFHQWEILHYPLMLTLYAQTQTVLGSLDKTEYQDFRKGSNAGYIIWNYLQREIWRYRGNMEDVMKCVLAAEFIAPYVAWRMQKDSLFFLDEDAFWEYCHTAYDMVSKLDAKQLPPHIRKVFRKNKSKYPEKEDTIEFIKEELRLFVERGDTYSLMHQQFRDALAALHLINVSYSSADLPTEWKYPIHNIVLDFVSELATQEEADRLWELNRNSSTSSDNSTVNMLELQKRKRNYDFTELDFSGLDLRKISLYPYRVPGSTALLLPRNSERNKGLFLSRMTLHSSGHSDAIRVVAVTPDGKKCLSGSLDKTLRVWDLETGQCVHVLKKHRSSINAVAITPDGKRYVSASNDFTLRVWEADKGRCLHVLDGHSGLVVTVAITPDGKRCISGAYDNTLRIWDLDKGECLHVLKGHESGIKALAITPDGKRCISGSHDKTLRIWNLDDGKCLDVWEGHTSYVVSVAITPDGKKCVSGSSDGSVRIWDLSNRPCVVIRGHERPIVTLAITPDGRRCVSGASDNVLRVWDLESGTCLHVLEGHNKAIETVTVTPDGNRCISGAWDNTLRVWDLDKGVCLHVLKGHTDYPPTVTVTPDGKRCISGAMDNSLRVWNLDNGQCMYVLEGKNNWVVSAAINMDNGKCITGISDNTLRVWDLETNRCFRVLEGHKGFVKGIALTADSKRCVTGATDKTLRLWDLETGLCRHVMKGHTYAITAVAITPDGDKCVSGSYDKTIRVWDLNKGKCVRILEGDSGFIRTVALTPDGQRCVCGSDDNTLSVWDLETGQCLNEWEGHRQRIETIAITPDGKRCVSGSADNTLREWNLETGQLLNVLKEHKGAICAIAIMQDGRCVSGAWDHALCFWDLEKGQCELTRIGSYERRRTVTAATDGKTYVNGFQDGTFDIINLRNFSTYTLEVLPLSLKGIDFSKSIIPDDLRETLRQNGAIV